MFKYILFVVFFISEVVSAQAVRTLNADYIDGNNSGFRNYAVNPYMDKNLAGITCTSFATCALTTTEKLQGTQSLSLTATSASGLAKLRAKAFDRELYGRNCEFSVDVFTSSSAAPHYDVYLENNGTLVSGTSTAMVQQQNRVQRYTVQAPCGSSTDGPYDLVIDSNATTGTNIKVDNFYAGLNRNIGTDSANYQWTSYTPTFTSMGSQSSINCEHAREGQDLLLRCTYTIGGSPAASEARVSLPGSLLSMSTLPSLSVIGVMTGTAADASSTYVLVEPSVGYVTFGVQASTASGLTKRNGNALVVAGNTYSFFARIPIQGWIVGNVIRMDQSNYDWTSYTPTYTNLGTPSTALARHRRVGTDVEVEVVFTPNSAPAAKASISLPPGISFHSSYPSSGSLYKIGSWVQNNAGATVAKQGVILADPAVPGFSFALQETANAASPTSPLNSNVFVSSNEYQIRAKFRVANWTENQNAPLLVGGVTSGFSGLLRIETASINTSGTVTERTGDWVNGNCTYSTGTLTCTWNNGIFSAEPTCIPIAKVTGGANSCRGGASGSATTYNGICFNTSTTSGVNTELDITCIGPR